MVYRSFPAMELNKGRANTTFRLLKGVASFPFCEQVHNNDADRKSF